MPAKALDRNVAFSVQPCEDRLRRAAPWLAHGQNPLFSRSGALPMAQNSSPTVARHLLHIPAPSPLPDRILRAMDTPIIDHRGPEFAKLARKCLDGIKTIFKTTNPVI